MSVEYKYSAISLTISIYIEIFFWWNQQEVTNKALSLARILITNDANITLWNTGKFSRNHQKNCKTRIKFLALTITSINIIMTIPTFDFTFVALSLLLYVFYTRSVSNNIISALELNSLIRSLKYKQHKWINWTTYGCQSTSLGLMLLCYRLYSRDGNLDLIFA